MVLIVPCFSLKLPKRKVNVAKMIKFYQKFEYFSILFAASAIIIFVFSSIVLRYLFNIVLSWPDELSRYLQLYIVWMGASASFTRKRVKSCC